MATGTIEIISGVNKTSSVWAEKIKTTQQATKNYYYFLFHH
jgi:hypothetical protein